MQFEGSDVVLFHGVVDLRKGAAGLLSLIEEPELGTKLIGALRQKLFGTGQGEKVDHAQLQIQLDLAEAELTSLYSQNQESGDQQVDEVVAQTQAEQQEEEPVQRIKRFSLPDDIEEREECIVPDEVLADPENFRQTVLRLLWATVFSKNPHS